MKQCSIFFGNTSKSRLVKDSSSEPPNQLAFLQVFGVDSRSLSDMINFNAGDGESLIHRDNLTTDGSGGVSVGTSTRFYFPSHITLN